MKLLSRALGRPLAVALSVALALLLLLSGSSALARGTLKIADPAPKEEDGTWKLKFTIDYGGIPHIAHVSFIFSFKPTMLYERALTDQSPDKPAERKVALAGQTPINLPMDVDFADMQGKVHKITKFDFKLRRSDDFQAGEYELTVKLADGGTIGAPTRITLQGENPVINRKSIIFHAEEKPKAKKSDDKGAKKADEPDTSKGTAQEDLGPDLSDIPSAPKRGGADPDGPRAVAPKQGGCGCTVPGGRAAPGRLVLFAACLVLAVARRGSRRRLARAGIALAALAFGCGGGQWQPPPCPSCPNIVPPGPGGRIAKDAGGAGASAEEAAAFMAEVEREVKRLWIKRERANWVQANFVTGDTQKIAAEAEQETMQYMARAIQRARRFAGLELEPTLARKLALLKIAQVLPAPSDAAKAGELAGLVSSMQATYATGKYCPERGGALRGEIARNRDFRELGAAIATCEPGRGGLSLHALTDVMAKSRDEAALREANLGWHTISPPVRDRYRRYVELGNEGAREIGFGDLGDLWRAGYDMSADAFRGEVERLWGQVKPLYDEMHCHVRAKLRQKYGEAVVPAGAPIPAHLLGNMWSQTWGNIYPLVEPFRGAGSVDVTEELGRQKYDAVKMVKLAEGFFTSLGLEPLPKTFWERSLFVKPRDREVECHASAWDVEFANDARIKMCIKINDDDLGTLHHELGHNYYYVYYHKLPILFQQGANDGFHEAVGDTIALSMTPSYLEKVGLARRPKTDEKAAVNYLMRMALDKVAFLPFGKLIDQWRWDVFAGKIAPERYNAGWWELRTRYQGIAPPGPRTEEHFDPGAKYHVPSNVPYIRYFLAYIYQFQFHRALCRIAEHQGPLHACSIYGNKKAGEKLRALLEMGASRPWQDALHALTGERAADASALLEYFEPLRGYLHAQIKDEKCGW
jgi:peptidyl-dipeptidase A